MSLIPIILPKLGESVAEATIIKWLKQPGDHIAKDENLAEVATDKVDTDLPSEYEGILHSIEVNEGEVAQVGATIAIIKVEGGIVPKENEIVVADEERPIAIASISANLKNLGSSSKAFDSTGLFLTPVVRNIAIEAGLTPDELASIQPTGSNKTRITKKDILNFLAPAPTAAVRKDVKRNLTIATGDQVVPLTRIRKLIAEHMATSVQTAAHVTSWAIADVTDIVVWRESNKIEFQESNGVKLTYTHVFMLLVTETLAAFPKLNAWLNGGEELIIKAAINLGFATATPDDNLIVPNIKNAQNSSLNDMARSVSTIGTAAKAGKLKPSDIENTTFTVSNTGIYGSLMGTPILALPQVATLALGEIVSAPGIVTIDNVETIAIRKHMHLSLSYDHRVIDGAYGSRFLRALKLKLENFTLEV